LEDRRMFDSIPVPAQVILWPLMGAAIALTLQRILPQWLGRLFAALAALAAFGTLWSLREADPARLQLFWEPVGIFRTGPALYVDGLSLFGGLVLTSVVAALVLGLRSEDGNVGLRWQGLILVALAGGLIVAMAANLPTLALGSALIDLALISTLLPQVQGSTRSPGPVWAAIIAGACSTLLLFAAALQMSAQLGTTSLLASDQSSQVLLLVALAGILRAMVFPIHPRKLTSPQESGLMLPAVGVGVLLLARAQSIEPILGSYPWIQALGSIAIIAGALLAWSTRSQPAQQLQIDAGDPAPERSQRSQGSTNDYERLWISILVHQTGFALVFLVQLGDTVPWPLFSLPVALGILSIWWNASSERGMADRSAWSEWLNRQLRSMGSRVGTHVHERIPVTGRWNSRRFRGVMTKLLPSIALASLAGLPLMAGALTRWPLYATVLARGQAGLLLALLVTDIFLAAGLWLAVAAVWRQPSSYRPQTASILAMLGLVGLLLITGLGPDRLPTSLGLAMPPAPDVSALGLGLLFALPWLVGAWLARVQRPSNEWLRRVWDLLNLEWFYRGVAWTGRQVRGVVHWIGVVGEGDGWWGWALAVLALGAVLLAIR
jgi:hypothetical protein